MSTVLNFISLFKCKSDCTCIREARYLQACKNCIKKSIDKLIEHRLKHPECYPGTKNAT